MKKKKLKKSVKIASGIIAICLALLIVYFVSPHLFNGSTSVSEAGTVETPVSSEQAERQTLYDNNKSVNSDYVGVLAFDSGLIEQNVVQGTDNEKYLTTTWNLQEDTSGAAFMDYRNNLSDQNLIIYGHYVYRDETKMFTPLGQLISQENYESNKTITLTLEDETRKYLITDVFYYTMGDQTMEYYFTGYGQTYFDTYYAAVKNADFYDTGETISLDDHWITLQTCVRDHDELREIVLAKEITES